jgi:hypothetical protein
MTTQQRDSGLLRSVAALQKKAGTVRLSDDDLLLLAYEEISRTTTYEEQSYHPDRPCILQ